MIDLLAFERRPLAPVVVRFHPFVTFGLVLPEFLCGFLLAFLQEDVLCASTARRLAAVRVVYSRVVHTVGGFFCATRVPARMSAQNSGSTDRKCFRPAALRAALTMAFIDLMSSLSEADTHTTSCVWSCR